MFSIFQLLYGILHFVNFHSKLRIHNLTPLFALPPPAIQVRVSGGECGALPPRKFMERDGETKPPHHAKVSYIISYHFIYGLRPLPPAPCGQVAVDRLTVEMGQFLYLKL